MRNRGTGFWAFVAVFAVAAYLTTTCASFLVSQAGAAGGPVLEDSFAVSSIWPGQDWRIYVKGSEADGEMDYIWFAVSQLGGNIWANHLIRLKGDERKAFAGYVTLPTPRLFSKRSYEYVRIEMRIKDKSGRYSEVRTHELTIGSPTKETLPVEWSSVSNHQLGTIFFDFESQPGEGSVKGKL